MNKLDTTEIQEIMANYLKKHDVVVISDGDRFRWIAMKTTADKWLGPEGPRYLCGDGLANLWLFASPVIDYERLNNEICDKLIKSGVPLYEV